MRRFPYSRSKKRPLQENRQNVKNKHSRDYLEREREREREKERPRWNNSENHMQVYPPKRKIWVILTIQQLLRNKYRNRREVKRR